APRPSGGPLLRPLLWTPLPPALLPLCPISTWPRHRLCGEPRLRPPPSLLRRPSPVPPPSFALLLRPSPWPLPQPSVALAPRLSPWPRPPPSVALPLRPWLLLRLSPWPLRPPAVALVPRLSPWPPPPPSVALPPPPSRLPR